MGTVVPLPPRRALGVDGLVRGARAHDAPVGVLQAQLLDLGRSRRDDRAALRREVRRRTPPLLDRLPPRRLEVPARGQRIREAPDDRRQQGQDRQHELVRALRHPARQEGLRPVVPHTHVIGSQWEEAQRPPTTGGSRRDDMSTAATPGALAGLRVLDLTIWRPGPYTTQLLAEHGADVLKVEPPGGDPMRSMPDLFDILGAGKRSIVLDLKRDEDRERCLELAAEADVFVESYRPGVADRLGVGYEAIAARNPTIVYCSVSGFGATGPLA